MLGHAGGDVGVMMLHADARQSVAFGPLPHVARRQVVRVEVAGQGLDLDAEQALEVLDPALEGAQRLVVLQVADVMADEGVVAAR